MPWLLEGSPFCLPGPRPQAPGPRPRHLLVLWARSKRRLQTVQSSVQASPCSLKAGSRSTPFLSTFSQAQARTHLPLHDWGHGPNTNVSELGISLGRGSCPDPPPCTMCSQERERKETRLPKPTRWPQPVSQTSAICLVSSSIC